MTVIAQYARVVERAARDVAPALHRSGLDVEDCEQEGWLALLAVLNTGVPVGEGLAYTICRRAAVKACRRRRGVQVEATYLESVEAKGEYAVSVEFRDLIDSAPGMVRVYLGLRVLDGMTWDECRAAADVSNERLATIREDAARWLLAAYEGRKYSG